MSFKTKKITQGAMIASIFGVLSLINTYTVGTFDLFILYAMVIPVVYYDYHNQLKDALILSIVSVVVIFLTGMPSFIVSAVLSLLEGIYIGECLKHHTSKITIILGVMMLALINNFLLYEVLSSLVGMNLVEEMTEMYHMMPGMLTNTVTLNQMLSLIPLVIILTGVLEGYVIIMLCSLTLRRFHITFPQDYYLFNMHLSKTTGLILILMIFVGVYGYKVTGISYYEYLFLFGMMALCIQGLSFVLYMSIIHNYSKMIRFILIILIFIPIVNYGYGILGLSDIFFDLRGIYGK